jgi:hypothetical protein
MTTAENTGGEGRGGCIDDDDGGGCGGGDDDDDDDDEEEEEEENVECWAAVGAEDMEALMERLKPL